MIKYKLKTWVPVVGINHIGTSWQLATDVGFTNLIDDVVNDTINLDLYYSLITTIVGTTYYIRAKRHFDNNTVGGWTNPVSVTDTGAGSGLVVNTDISVSVPIVYANRAEILDTTITTITLSTSNFKSIGDGHSSTHWLVTDTFGKILYSNLNDSVNLTTIVINKSDITINGLDSLVFTAIHRTSLGIESKPGTVVVSMYDINYVITSNLARVTPNVDFDININKIDNNFLSNVLKIELLDYKSNNSLWTKLYSNKDLTKFTIPGSLLSAATEYKVILYTESTAGKILEVTNKLTTVESIETYTIDYNYTYSKELSFFKDEAIMLLPNNAISQEIYDSNILYYSNTDALIRLAKIDRTNSNFTITTTVLSGIELLNTNNDNTYIHYRPDNKIVIDTIDNSGVPSFLIYDYNPYFNTGVLLYAIPRVSEIESIGKTGSITQITSDTYQYVSTNDNILRELNITTGVITDVVTLGTTNLIDNILFNISNNRVMTISGTDSIGWVYNLTDGTFTEGVSVPTKFRNRQLKVIELINGDKLIVRTIYDNVNDIDNDILYYSYGDSTLTVAPFNFNSSLDFNTVVKLKTGEILLVDKTTTDKYFIFK